MMISGIRDLSSDPGPDDTIRNHCIETIIQGLEAFDRSVDREAHDRPLILAVFDDDERVVGGLLGKLLRGWLRIDMLWVAEQHRRAGYGRRLVDQAEKTALAQGCRAVHLETYSYQAPEFYLKLGYEVFAELNDCPPGEIKYYLKKNLAPSEAG